MSTPKRIQRQRTPGWCMPEGAVYVGRPTAFGNPFVVGVPFCGPTITTLHTVAEVVTKFEAWLSLPTLEVSCWDHDLIVAHLRLKAALRQGGLTGRDLACWCQLEQPCHADVLLRLANTTAVDTHACPGRCGRQVAQHLYACRACWGRLPYRLRQPITANYQRDAAAHAAAMATAAAWFQQHVGVRT